MIDDNDSRDSPARRLRFTLWDLMQATCGIGVGAAVLRLDQFEWTDGVLAAAAYWIILGLLHQVRDLWRAYRNNTELSSDERWGWRIAAAARIGVAGILAQFFVVEYFLRSGDVLAWDTSATWSSFGAESREAFFYLALVFAMLSAPRLHRRNRKRSRISRVVNLLAWFAAGVYCLIVWCEHTLIHYFVYIAILGIEQSWSLKFARLEGLDVLAFARGARFFWWSLAAFVVVPVNLMLAFRLSHRKPLARSWKCLLAALLVAGLSFTTGYVIWVYAAGIQNISAPLAEGLTPGRGARLLTALLLVGVIVTAISYARVRACSTSVRNEDLSWRRNHTKYYHESRFVMATLAVPLLAFLVDILISMHLAYGTFSSSFTQNIQYAIYILFGSPSVTLWVAVTLVAVKGTFVGLIRPQPAPQDGPPRVPLVRFVCVWLMMFVTVASAAGVMVWFSFAMWLSPWLP